MAMPKKGSRSIVVDDTPYRWRLRSENDCRKSMIIAVEPVTESGDVSVLTVDTSAPSPSPVGGSPYNEEVSVTPAVVEAYIRLALTKGWKPGERGKPFVLVADAAMVTGKT